MLEVHKGVVEGENSALEVENLALKAEKDELNKKLAKASNFMFDTRHKMYYNSILYGIYHPIKSSALCLKDGTDSALDIGEYKNTYTDVTGIPWGNDTLPSYFPISGGGKLDKSPYITYGGAAGIIGGNILVNNCKCLLIGILILLVLYFIYIMVCECINSYKTKKYRYQYII